MDVSKLQPKTIKIKIRKITTNGFSMRIMFKIVYVVSFVAVAVKAIIS